MSAIIDNLVSNIPQTVVMGYFAKQFIKRLDTSIAKIDDQEKRILRIEITEELKEKQQSQKQI